MLIIPTV